MRTNRAKQPLVLVVPRTVISIASKDLIGYEVEPDREDYNTTEGELIKYTLPKRAIPQWICRLMNIDCCSMTKSVFYYHKRNAEVIFLP